MTTPDNRPTHRAPGRHRGPTSEDLLYAAAGVVVLLGMILLGVLA